MLLWNTRHMWSGETPLDYPHLNPVALTRIRAESSIVREDEVDASHEWELINGSAPGNDLVGGPWGRYQLLNNVDPATSQSRMVLDYFSGLWPTSGKLLVGLWHWHNYTMEFNPFLSTRRGGSGTDPMFYLSSHTAGQPRHQLYGPGNSLILDQYEASPFVGHTGWLWLGQLIDIDNSTSQMLTVKYSTGESWISPVRTASGSVNTATTAPLDVFGLQANGFWTGGGCDEVMVAHPSAEFDAAEFVDAVARGTWARGQYDDAEHDLDVTDSGVTALSARVLETGAERVEWVIAPIVDGAPSGSVPYWSDDGGDTWDTGALPEPFAGLLRWSVPLASSESFAGITLTVPTTPAPTLEPIADVEMLQGGTVEIPLDFTVTGSPSWTVSGQLVTGSVSGDTLSLVAGYAVGEALITVTLTDESDRSVSQSFTVTVSVQTLPDSPPPAYSGSPIVVWDEAGPSHVVVDPISAVVTAEINGEETLTFSVPAKSESLSHIVPERAVSVEDNTYRVRRITTKRTVRGSEVEVHCEAMWYDLATAGQIDATEWTQVTAGDVISIALGDTEWRPGVVEVTNLRTYSTDDTNPLALLREVQKQHGGDLVFDSENREVHLLIQAGNDNGVAFFYGKDLTESKRVVDTTSLVTRIYARNEEGVTIASVNNGLPYVEDFSYTSEVRTAVYDFKSGTSPFTMLSMANATLANRAKPSYSYEVTVADLSVISGQTIDRFGVGDRVTVSDEGIGLLDTQRIVELRYDLIRPWKTKLVLSAKLRESGSSDATDAGVFTTGATIPTFDMVPFNLLLNSRFDNGLQHWAYSGVDVVEANQGTSSWAVEFTGSGTRWIEQTVSVDRRRAYALSLDVVSRGPSGWVPDLVAEATVVYEDDTSETIAIDLE